MLCASAAENLLQGSMGGGVACDCASGLDEAVDGVGELALPPLFEEPLQELSRKHSATLNTGMNFNLCSIVPPKEPQIVNDLAA